VRPASTERRRGKASRHPPFELTVYFSSHFIHGKLGHCERTCGDSRRAQQTGSVGSTGREATAFARNETGSPIMFSPNYGAASSHIQTLMAEREDFLAVNRTQAIKIKALEEVQHSANWLASLLSDAVR